MTRMGPTAFVLFVALSPGIQAQIDSSFHAAFVAAKANESADFHYGEGVRSQLAQRHNDAVAACLGPHEAGITRATLLIRVDDAGTVVETRSSVASQSVACALKVLADSVVDLPPTADYWVQMGVSNRPLLKSVAGVEVGSGVPALISRLGRGCVGNPRYPSERFFVDRARRFTVSTDTEHGDHVDTVTVRAGVQLPKRCSVAAATTPRLSSEPAAEHGIRLGVPPSYVISVLGPPDEDSVRPDGRKLTYRAYYLDDLRVELAYDADFDFSGGRLAGIAVHYGE